MTEGYFEAGGFFPSALHPPLVVSSFFVVRVETKKEHNNTQDSFSAKKHTLKKTRVGFFSGEGRKKRRKVQVGFFSLGSQKTEGYFQVGSRAKVVRREPGPQEGVLLTKRRVPLTSLRPPSRSVLLVVLVNSKTDTHKKQTGNTKNIKQKASFLKS